MMRSQERKQGRRVRKFPHPPKMLASWCRQPTRPICRVYWIKPDHTRCERVEVIVTRTPKAMDAAWRRHECRKLQHDAHIVAGRCQSYFSRLSGAAKLVYRLTVARIYFNGHDLRRRPSEISSHEVGHAAMAYARWLRLDLGRMEGEEIMVHALGRMVSQVNMALYAAGVWRGMM